MSTIAVVDDNPDNRKLFRAVLTRAGHRVLEFPSGVGLVAALAGEAIDLVLLDIQLPDRDGFAVLEDLREGRPELRVLAVTAQSLDADRERIGGAGFDGMVTKPIDIGRFPGQVARAMAGSRVVE